MPKNNLNFKSTKDISIPKKIIEQVIGQESAVRVIQKAAQQRRHVLLIGEPGTGKSMLGLALAELLPKEKLVDTLSFFNPNDENQPLIREMPAGKGRELVTKEKINNKTVFNFNSWLPIIGFILISMFLSYDYSNNLFFFQGKFDHPVIFATTSIILILVFVMFVISMQMNKRTASKTQTPKVIVDNYKKKQAPFFDATGAHAGALLGDVLHDPFQTGGLGTPAHERVVAGMIHKANMGVLFIDEVATLQSSTQQDLLTALQEGRYSITGQSERSAGAMVRTEPVPCNFILVAAGNLETLKHMHPALRSRIRGYGYEVHMSETMLDTPENQMKIAKFIAQEVTKDKRIPHFNKPAVLAIIEEARRRANRKGHLTLRLRELGGLVRAAGDIALEQNAKIVTPKHLGEAKKISRVLEQQIADKYIERKKEYEVIVTKGKQIGRVNGLAVIGGDEAYSGIILPIESEVTLGGKKHEIIATGKLGDIAKEAVKNVSAIIMRYFGEDIKETRDIYVQFLQTYEGVEGDSASIAVATSIISALKKVPVRQDTAMTGSLSVRGEVLPIGGVSAKVEAAVEAGLKQVLVPKSNMKDIVIDQSKLDKIKLIPVEKISEVLNHALDWKNKPDILKKISKN